MCNTKMGVETWSCSWFNTMLSRDRSTQPTKLARFHELTGLVIYVVAGLSMLCGPILWQLCLALQFSSRTEGCFRLVGMEVVAIGFNYILIGRALFPVDQGQGHILSSIPERLILVNGCILVLVVRDMIPLWFGVIFMCLDTILALLTFLVWYKENEGSSFVRFFKEIWLPLCRPYSINRNGASLAVILVGVLQFTVGLFFTVKPDTIHDVLQLEVAGDYKVGFLGTYFFACCVNGVFHLYMGKAESLAFAIGAVFYRIVFNIPITILLFGVDRLELNLCLFIVIVQFAFVMIISTSLCGRVHHTDTLDSGINAVKDHGTQKVSTKSKHSTDIRESSSFGYYNTHGYLATETETATNNNDDLANI